MKIKDRIKELRRVKASELLPNPRNWRKHPEAQQNAMRGILAEVGIADAVLARETPDGLMLIDGHLRVDVDPGTVWPVLVLDVTEAEADKILATHDPLAAMAETDPVLLDSLLREVETGSQELADMLEKLAEDAGLYLDDQEPAEIEEDEAPEPPAEPITKPGDLWVLGDHRVLCGDSTKAEDVARLMAGAKADLCFTSPPYNVGKQQWSNGKPKYANDTDDKPQQDYAVFLNDVTSVTLTVCSMAVINIQMVAGNKQALVEWMHHFRSNLADVAIWDKQTAEPAMQPGVMDSSFEFLVVLSSKENATRKLPFTSFRGGCHNVYRAGKMHNNEFAGIHQAVFPVHLPAWCMGVFSLAMSIYDPFLGSGTTLIAAEQLGRKCYGMEISPQYVDVIVARWEQLTGRKAELEQ